MFFLTHGVVNVSLSVINYVLICYRELARVICYAMPMELFSVVIQQYRNREEMASCVYNYAVLYQLQLSRCWPIRLYMLSVSLATGQLGKIYQVYLRNRR